MTKFEVRVADHADLTAFDHVWGPAALARVLQAAGFDDVADVAPADVEEMCLLALQDLGPVGAAEVVLRDRLADRLRPGQIAQLAQDFGEEAQWEHHADMTLHESLFHAGELLWKAMPGRFPKPDAVQLDLEVRPADDSSREVLAEELDEVLLVRLLADGMPPTALLHRLFEDDLERGAFEEATAIVWSYEVSPLDGGLRVRVVGSEAWLGCLRQADTWTSDARPATEDDEA